MIDGSWECRSTIVSIWSTAPINFPNLQFCHLFASDSKFSENRLPPNIHFLPPPPLAKKTLPSSPKSYVSYCFLLGCFISFYLPPASLSPSLPLSPSLCFFPSLPFLYIPHGRPLDLCYGRRRLLPGLNSHQLPLTDGTGKDRSFHI